MALREAAEKALAALESCTPGDYVIHPWFDERLCDEAKEALRAELARPPEPAAAPDGWQLVPVEPTPGMVAAYLGSNRDYWQIVDEKPTVLGKWRNGTPEEAVAFAYASMLAAAPRPPEPAAHPSTPIDALLQQYADECSDFSGPDGYAFALKIANRYAESGPDCQMRCVVHTLLNPPEPATQGEPLTDERIKAIYARETGFNLDSSPAALMDFARAVEAAHGITDSAAGDKP